MAKIKLYIDEDLTDRLAVALRSRKFDVISAHEVEMRGKTDKEQLDYAVKDGRIILTRNVRHFVKLQREYFEKKIDHYGIVVTDYLHFKELLRRLLNFLNKTTAEEMENRLEWLQNYK